MPVLPKNVEQNPNFMCIGNSYIIAVLLTIWFTYIVDGEPSCRIGRLSQKRSRETTVETSDSVGPVHFGYRAEDPHLWMSRSLLDSIMSCWWSGLEMNLDEVKWVSAAGGPHWGQATEVPSRFSGWVLTHRKPEFLLIQVFVTLHCKKFIRQRLYKIHVACVTSNHSIRQILWRPWRPQTFEVKPPLATIAQGWRT